jgi:hypothetical protein
MAQNIKGRTRGRRLPLRPEGTFAASSWQQHAQPFDPLTAARNARRKKK